MARNAPDVPTGRLAVLDRIRRGDDTVNAIAGALGVTDNAVRLHLAALERDGLIDRSGVRHSGRTGQPAVEYGVTVHGEAALSKAFQPALTALVEALGARLEARGKHAVFADAGRRLADGIGTRATGSVAERANACAALIESLGGAATVASARGRAVITGAGCPLASAVRGEPATCTIIEALLERHAGLSVTQRCAHGERPACKFELSAKGE